MYEDEEFITIDREEELRNAQLFEREHAYELDNAELARETREVISDYNQQGFFCPPATALEIAKKQINDLSAEEYALKHQLYPERTVTFEGDMDSRDFREYKGLNYMPEA